MFTVSKIRCAQRLAALERATGIEPVFEAWEAAVLPLNHARSSRTDFTTIKPSVQVS